MIESDRRGDALVLTVEDPRIDAARAVAFKDAVRRALTPAPGDPPPDRVVMDLSGVEFIDSSGLGALAASAKALGGGTLHLAGAQPLVLKVLRLTHMDRVFGLHDDVGAALTAEGAT